MLGDEESTIICSAETNIISANGATSLREAHIICRRQHPRTFLCNFTVSLHLIAKIMFYNVNNNVIIKYMTLKINI